MINFLLSGFIAAILMIIQHNEIEKISKKILDSIIKINLEKDNDNFWNEKKH